MCSSRLKDLKRPWLRYIQFDAGRLFSSWIPFTKRLARKLLLPWVCCIELGLEIVPNWVWVAQERWSFEVVGIDQFSQGDPGLCWGCSAFLIVDLSYGQNLVHGERTSRNRVDSGSSLGKPFAGNHFRLVPYRFCSDGNAVTLSALLWSHLILSDPHNMTV